MNSLRQVRAILSHAMLPLALGNPLLAKSPATETQRTLQSILLARTSRGFCARLHSMPKAQSTLRQALSHAQSRRDTIRLIELFQCFPEDPQSETFLNNIALGVYPQWKAYRANAVTALLVSQHAHDPSRALATARHFFVDPDAHVRLRAAQACATFSGPDSKEALNAYELSEKNPSNLKNLKSFRLLQSQRR